MSKSITDADPNRSLIPTEIDHRRRSESLARHRSVAARDNPPAVRPSGVFEGCTLANRRLSVRKIREVLRRRFAAALSGRGIALQPSCVAVDGRRLRAWRRGRRSGVAGPGVRRRRGAGTTAVSDAAAKRHIASASDLERRPPGAAAQGRDALAAVAGVQGDPPGRPAVQPLLRAVPGLGGQARRRDAPGASCRRADVRRLRRPDRAVVDPETGELRQAQVFVAVLGASSYHVRRGDVDADPPGLDRVARPRLSLLRRLPGAGRPRLCAAEHNRG